MILLVAAFKKRLYSQIRMYLFKFDFGPWYCTKGPPPEQALSAVSRFPAQKVLS